MVAGAYTLALCASDFVTAMQSMFSAVDNNSSWRSANVITVVPEMVVADRMEDAGRCGETAGLNGWRVQVKTWSMALS